MKESINIKNAPIPVGPYSQAVIHNNVMYASGQIAINPKNGELINNDVKKELVQILDNIDSLLEAANIKRNHILKCSIFLKNMNPLIRIFLLQRNFWDILSVHIIPGMTRSLPISISWLRFRTRP